MARSWICFIFVGVVLGSIVLPAFSMAETRYNDWELWTSPAVAILPNKNTAKDPLTINIAGGVVAAPKYFGSGSHALKTLPLLDVNYAGKLFLSTQDGIGWNAWRKFNIRAGPRITFDHGRRAADATILRGLPDIDFGTEVGFFIESFNGPLRLKADIRKEIGGGHGGLLMNGEIAWGSSLSKNSSIILGLRGTYMDDIYAKSYFSVSAVNARVGRLQYTPQNGVRDFNGFFQIVYNLNQALYVAGEFRGTVLMKQSGDSPLADVEHPFFGSLNGFVTSSLLVGYRF